MSDKPSNWDIIELRNQFFATESDFLRDEVVTKCVWLMDSFDENDFSLSGLKWIVVSRCIQLWTDKLLDLKISTILVPASVSRLGALWSWFVSRPTEVLDSINEKKELQKIREDIEQYFKDHYNGYELPTSLLIDGLVHSKNPRNKDKPFVTTWDAWNQDVKINYLSL